MVHYEPKLRRKNIKLPFGYFVSPIDPNIIIPDPPKLEAIEYAFRMRAKYKTPLRDCCMWLHAQTGQRMTAAGFMYAYKRWVKRVRKLNGKALAVKSKKALEEKKQQLKENFGSYTVKINDAESVLTLANLAAEKEIRKF